jgi:hypothetical protein
MVSAVSPSAIAQRAFCVRQRQGSKQAEAARMIAYQPCAKFVDPTRGRARFLDIAKPDSRR